MYNDFGKIKSEIFIKNINGEWIISFDKTDNSFSIYIKEDYIPIKNRFILKTENYMNELYKNKLNNDIRDLNIDEVEVNFFIKSSRFFLNKNSKFYFQDVVEKDMFIRYIKLEKIKEKIKAL